MSEKEDAWKVLIGAAEQECSKALHKPLDENMRLWVDMLGPEAADEIVGASAEVLENLAIRCIAAAQEMRKVQAKAPVAARTQEAE